MMRHMRLWQGKLFSQFGAAFLTRKEALNDSQTRLISHRLQQFRTFLSG